MNRLIRLFQAKSDLAYEKFLKNRAEGTKHEINSPAFSAAVMRGAHLLSESETWRKAADLLRKEELNVGRTPNV